MTIRYINDRYIVTIGTSKSHFCVAVTIHETLKKTTILIFQ